MSNPDQFVVLEGNSLAVMAWVTGLDAAPLTQSSIPGTGGITREIRNRTLGTVLATDHLLVSDVVYNTPQTGKGWPAIYTTGFNWRDLVSGVSWTELEADTEVQIVYYFEDADGLPIVWATQPFQVENL